MEDELRKQPLVVNSITSRSLINTRVSINCQNQHQLLEEEKKQQHKSQVSKTDSLKKQMKCIFCTYIHIYLCLLLA